MILTFPNKYLPEQNTIIRFLCSFVQINSFFSFYFACNVNVPLWGNFNCLNVLWAINKIDVTVNTKKFRRF